MSPLGHARPGRAISISNHVRYATKSDDRLSNCDPSLRAINVRFASRRTAAKVASLFDEAGGVVRDMTEIDLTGEHA